MQETKHRNIRTTYFVPGRRWLLVASREGGVLAFDLNASPTTKTVLIPPDGDPQLMEMTAINIQSNPRTQDLTFNMASLPYCKLPLCYSIVCLTDLWHGTSRRFAAGQNTCMEGYSRWSW